VGGQRVVLVEVAEGRLRASELVRRNRRATASRKDAELRRVAHSVAQPGVMLPRLGPWPLGIPTELPAAGVALGQGSSSCSGAGVARSGASHTSAPIADATSARAWKL